MSKGSDVSNKTDKEKSKTNPSLSNLGIYMGLLLIVIVLLIHEAYLGLVVDDAYISFRFAKNFVDGYGLVFNHGEQVEGYSNFLWVLIISGAMKFSLEPLAVAKILGQLFSALTLIVAFRLSQRISKQPTSYLNLIAPLIIAVNGSFAAWSVSGLESAMFAFLTAMGIYFYITEEEKPSRFLSSGIFFGLSALTRPEGAFIFLLTLIFRSIQLSYKRENPKKNDAMIIAGFAAIFLPYFVWRYSYYGYLFPNTFYAKNGANIGFAKYRFGLKYVLKFFSGYNLIFPLTIFTTLLLMARRSRTLILYLLWIVCVYTLYIFSVGGDSQRLSRFFIPLLLPIALVIQEGLRYLYEFLITNRTVRIESHNLPPIPQVWKSLSIAIMVLAISVSSLSVSFLTHKDEVKSELSLVNALSGLGKWFKVNAPPGTLIAACNVGALCYFSELPTIDMMGLTDVHIAHYGNENIGGGIMIGHNKHDAQYVLERAPEFVVFDLYLSKGLNVNNLWPAEKELLSDQVFLNNYEPTSMYSVWKKRR